MHGRNLLDQLPALNLNKTFPLKRYQAILTCRAPENPFEGESYLCSGCRRLSFAAVAAGVLIVKFKEKRSLHTIQTVNTRI